MKPYEIYHHAGGFLHDDPDGRVYSEGWYFADETGSETPCAGPFATRANAVIAVKVERCKASDDFDFGEGRTRLRRAFAEGAKVLNLSAQASKNTGPVGWCAACVKADHAHCESRPGGSGGNCLCPALHRFEV